MFDATTPGPSEAATLRRRDDASSAWTAAELAHEINSLIDGGSRPIRRALAMIQAGACPPEIAHQVGDELMLTQRALEHMARLVAASLPSHLAGPQITHAATIREEIDFVHAANAAVLARHAVDLSIRVDEAVAGMPAGPLAACLMNGLRNATSACCDPGVAVRRIEIEVELSALNMVELLIVDTGAGVENRVDDDPADSPADPFNQRHGIGLALCSRLVEELGGWLHLYNVPFNRGAVLHVVIPAAALIRRSATAHG